MRARTALASQASLTAAGMNAAAPDHQRPALRLAPRQADRDGPEKYQNLDLKRRRAQIRARRALGLT